MPRIEPPLRLGGLLLLGVLAGCATMPPDRLNAPGDRGYEVSVARIGGRVAVAWHGGRMARDALFIRYLAADGRGAGPPMQLTDASRDAFEPSLQALDGEALVAWYEQDDRHRQVALLARFDAQGRPRWRLPLSAPDANGRNPVVRVAGQAIHVAWIEQSGEAEPRLRAAIVGEAGEWLSLPREVAVVSRDTWNLNAAIDSRGAFHVVHDAGVGTRGQELRDVRVWEEEAAVASLGEDDGHDSVYPDLAFDGERAALTWFDYRDGNAEVYLRCMSLEPSGALSANGAAGDLRVTHSPGESIGAYLAWHRGRIHLAWSEADDTSQRLLLQVFDRDCHPLGKPKAVSTRRGVAGIPSLAADGEGLALAWNERIGELSELRRHGHSREPSSTVLLRILR